MLATMALAGPRVGEVCTLRWRDVKLASSRLRVADAKPTPASAQST
jgi:integrase